MIFGNGFAVIVSERVFQKNFYGEWKFADFFSEIFLQSSQGINKEFFTTNFNLFKRFEFVLYFSYLSENPSVKLSKRDYGVCAAKAV